MTIKELIDIVDGIKPNQYGIEEKVRWLSFVEHTIINDVIMAYEGYEGQYDNFEGYSPDKLDVQLIVKAPHDRLYEAFLKMKIDEENGETARYNNSATMYNTYLMEYKKWYNKNRVVNCNGNRAMSHGGSASKEGAMDKFMALLDEKADKKSVINPFKGFVNVLDYEADNRGVKDSTLAFNRAIRYCNENGKSLYIPSGVYSIENDLIDINSGISIIGDLDAQTEDRYTGTFIHDKRLNERPLFNFIGEGVGGEVRDITFWCYNKDYQYETTCIKTEKSGWDFRIENCTFAHYDCALNLNGNDTFIKAVRIVFCGIKNYALELNTNSSFIYDLHMEHCRHMVHTPYLYSFANHFIGCKFEMSTFMLGIDSASPMLFEGYHSYGLVNFTDCNFYNLDFIAYMESGIEVVPYMISFGDVPSILLSTKYSVGKFNGCLFNIGAGSGAYTFEPISNATKYILSTKPIEVTNCSFHNLSGDFAYANSIEVSGSYSKVSNNELHYAFDDYRNDAKYGTYCKEIKQLPYIYNCDFENNRVYYDDTVFEATTTECPCNNEFISLDYDGMSMLPVGDAKLNTSTAVGWIKLFETDKYVNGSTIYLDFDVAEYYNGMCENFVFVATANSVNANKFDTGAWKFKKESLDDKFNERMVAVIDGDKIKIYYNTSYDNRVVGNSRVKLKVNDYCGIIAIKKANRMIVEAPDLSKPYIYAE